MSHYKIGFIGCGNMGGAIAKGILAQTALQEQFSLCVFEHNLARIAELTSAGISLCNDLGALVKDCDFILIAVKPHRVKSVIEEIKGLLTKDKTIISIAAAVGVTSLRTMLDSACPAVQIMPNTPVLTGEGVFALCLEDPLLSDIHKTAITDLFSALGVAFLVPEQKMTAFSAIAGCGPSYVFHMMDAVMEAAVTLGFTRDESTRMTTALFKGSVSLVEATGKPLGVLHAEVTSPGGMTIAGTNHLSRTAVRGHIIDAILVAHARGKEMENEV